VRHPAYDRGVPPPRLPIATERLLLRRLEEADLRALHAIQSREDVTRWLYWTARTEDEVREAIARHRAAPADRELTLAATRADDGVFVGTASAWLSAPEHRQAEIGFLLHPDHHGRGYATEAARAMVDVAVDDFGAHRVVGRVEPRNVASARVLERLGMRKEAHLVANERVRGEWQSEAIYAVLAREWRAARGR
jgi:RimJ/RimL family protein N-acetyltransferase